MRKVLSRGITITGLTLATGAHADTMCVTLGNRASLLQKMNGWCPRYSLTENGKAAAERLKSAVGQFGDPLCMGSGHQQMMAKLFKSNPKIEDAAVDANEPSFRELVCAEVAAKLRIFAAGQPAVFVERPK